MGNHANPHRLRPWNVPTLQYGNANGTANTRFDSLMQKHRGNLVDMTRRHGAMPNYTLDLDHIPRAITWPTLRVLVNVESRKTCKIFFPIFLKAVRRAELTAAGSSGETGEDLIT
ncbi:hypothetical protein HD554DRAFT_2040726 [Boletus coccyginus]|nr:hypothetical protein HD554DRAFT_2040726 [Boletus coccyginus]